MPPEFTRSSSKETYERLRQLSCKQQSPTTSRRMDGQTKGRPRRQADIASVTKNKHTNYRAKGECTPLTATTAGSKSQLEQKKKGEQNPNHANTRIISLSEELHIRKTKKEGDVQSNSKKLHRQLKNNAVEPHAI